MSSGDTTSEISPLDLLSKRIRTSIGAPKFSENQLQDLTNFLQNDGIQCLFAFYLNGPDNSNPSDAEFHISYELPLDESKIDIIFYTMKLAPKQSYLSTNPERKVIKTVDGLLKETQYGVIRAPFLNSMLEKVKELFAPTFFDIDCWPDSIRNDFNSQLHRYLSMLTDQKHRIAGKTVIYVPKEGLNLSIEVAARDKEYISRLENAMIHWTRQIKDVLNAQETSSNESGELTDAVGPLDEIIFWENRCNDLSGLSDQLDKPEVRKIQKILEQAKSSYVNQFRKLSKQISQGNKMAKSNLEFLKLLENPCKNLAKSPPSAIPQLLDEIIMQIRFIWCFSKYYNTRERLTALFRKLSNEIIRICCNSIDLEKIFDGHVFTSRKSILDCINACKEWKSSYKYAQKVHHKMASHTYENNTPWVLDESGIFAQVDAFIQRCKDLLDVCECQEHFARWQDGSKTITPVFHGQRGPEMVRTLIEIEDAFTKHVNKLLEVKSNILNVKSTQWHDYYTRFRTNVKDLEVMVQTLLTQAFDSHQTIQNYIHVLEIFEHFKVRENIRRELDKKTKDMWFMFTEEVNRVKRLLAMKKPDVPNMPKYAGAAHWARLLKRRVERPMEELERAKVFLSKTGSGQEAKASYNNLIQALEDFVRQTFAEWSASVAKESLSTRLDQPLMIRSSIAPELLDVNFDPVLLKLFEEIHHWERLMFEIPHYAAEIYLKKDELRTLREHVLLVVRDYNNIITALNPNERLLFKERIRVLDKKITPGLTKLTWSNKGMSDFFVSECRNHANKVMQTVKEYKASGKSIARKCKAISELLLVKIDGKTIYNDLQFGQVQRGHRMKMKEKIFEHYQDIIKYLTEMSEAFKRDGADVYQKWIDYVESVDGHLQEAIRINIKSSLIELSQAIHGNGKVPPPALFKVDVLLENRYNKMSDGIYTPAQIIFEPNLDTLNEDVSQLTYSLAEAFDGLRRLTAISRLVKVRTDSKPSFVDVIDCDDDISKQRRSIMEGMMANKDQCMIYLDNHDKDYSLGGLVFLNDRSYENIM